MTTENMALVALIASLGSFSISAATAVLDLWVWGKVAKICREAATSGKKEKTK